MFKSLLNRLTSSAPAPTLPAAPVVVAGDPARADVLIEEGDRLESAGDLAAAEELYRQATVVAPGHARGGLYLGIVLTARDDQDEAIRAYETVLAIDRQHAFGNYNLARVMYVRQDFGRAEALLRQALRTRPEFPQALVMLGNVLDSLGKLEEAAEATAEAGRLQPTDGGIWYNLALLQFRLDRADEAEASAHRLLEAVPGHAAGMAMLGMVGRNHGFVDRLIESLQAAIRNDPEFLAYQSQILMLRNFVDDLSARQVYEEHVEFGRRLETRYPVRFDRFKGDRDPGRRLRVGYLSSDLHAHPVALFMLPLLEHLDRGEVEVFCYSVGGKTDATSERLRERSDHWRALHSLSDAQVADQIHADAIDILVELTGNASAPRLGVLAQRPAPVQASWLGYLNTTGLTRIDYRLSDGRCDPPALSQPLHTERLLLLPNSQWCYRPFTESALVPDLPSAKNGYLTFGSFNSSLKLTQATLLRWAELLRRVEGSRLLILDVPSVRRQGAIRDVLADAGVGTERYAFAPRVRVDEYYDLISSVDIALDSYPYGGGTTTFDALWMGVPVVTAVGDLPVSRSAASVLAALDMAEWIAPTIDEFVDVAVARAADREALASQRRSLRARLQSSPLTDHPRFARDMEAAFRQMWRNYCA